MSLRSDEDAPPNRCLHCNERLAGAYCHRCGEKSRHDLSLAGYAGELVYAITHLDGKVAATLRLLFTRPGALSRAYVLGHRKAYLKPLVVFVLANVLFFLAQTIGNINTFNSTLTAQTRWLPYSAVTRPIAEARIRESGMAADDYERLYNTASEQIAKSVLIIQIPMLAGVLALLYVRSPRFYVEHLVFATHFLAFVLLVDVLITIVFAVWRSFSSTESWNFGTPYLIGLGVYLAFAVRQAYGHAWLGSLVRGAVLAVAFVLVITAYRLVLFFLTIAST